MDKKLKNLFDYQAFEKDSKLESVIKSVDGIADGAALDLDDLDMVAGGRVIETSENEIGPFNPVSIKITP